MIEFERFELPNGLKVLFHKDKTTPMAVVNTLYDVGARDESEEKTGFAHLFEHLMFGGSVNIPDFDAPLQRAGGESNAFTSNDITNYYDHVPAQNLDTALWLESDRMLSLAFTEKSLEVQRQVVIEEFKQRYLNQPYGDVWLNLLPLAYKKHPYKWATIGKDISHIEDATMDDVRRFFQKYYHPNNAILCVAGNFELNFIQDKISHWYGDIPTKLKPARIVPSEPEQTEFRELTLERNVPADAFYYAFKMSHRKSFEYYITDLISDALGREKSSRLYNKLKKELNLVSEINAYITGTLDEGLLMISGKMNDGVGLEKLDKELWSELAAFVSEPLSETELNKLNIKIRTAREFRDQGLLNRAMNLCQYELLGDAAAINEDLNVYQSITSEHICEVGRQVLKKENCSLLKIKRKEA
ncbi:MAG: M16 family metallopeptidase [Bacteroidota bacterium]